MQEIQRAIFDALSATSEIGHHPGIRDPRSFEDARSTLRLIHDNFDLLIEQRGGLGLVELLREASGRVRSAARGVLPTFGDEHRALRRAVDALERQVGALGRSLEIPSRPLLGVLPVARVVPQDVHSMLDYTDALACGLAAGLAGTGRARAAAATLAVAAGGLSAITDYRLSVAKVVPIEVHETIDYVWSALAIAAPFVLGFARKDRAASAIFIAMGAATALGALFTDYRAARGVGRGWGDEHDRGQGPG